MAPSNINTNSGDSKGRATLVTVDKVYGHSLPRSLRHCTMRHALEDAKAMVHFLDQVVDAFAKYPTILEAEACIGMGLVLNLITDKLEIGSGSYKFPTIGWNTDDPFLVKMDK